MRGGWGGREIETQKEDENYNPARVRRSRREGEIQTDKMRLIDIGPSLEAHRYRERETEEVAAYQYLKLLRCLNKDSVDYSMYATFLTSSTGSVLFSRSTLLKRKGICFSCLRLGLIRHRRSLRSSRQVCFCSDQRMSFAMTRTSLTSIAEARESSQGNQPVCVCVCVHADIKNSE